jgi:serine/threonine protein kinase
MNFDDSNMSASRIGSYHLVKSEIGRGTYSTVALYKRVRPGISGGLFAIKCLNKSDLSRSQCAVYKPDGDVSVEPLSFQVDRELSILRALQQKHCRYIVRLEEVIETESEMIIVYPFAGHTCMVYDEDRTGYSANMLESPCAPSSVFPVLHPDDAMECLRQLLCAVVVIHESGICHKDIKPDNILLASRLTHCRTVDSSFDPPNISSVPSSITTPIQLTLCDFNTAEYVCAPGNMIYDAQGTVLFTPPEAFMHSHDGIDGFARDMWSVGSMAYVMLTGCLPVTGQRSLEIQLKLLGMANNGTVGLELPKWCLEGVSERMISVVESLLRIDPRNRPKAVEALGLMGTVE